MADSARRGRRRRAVADRLEFAAASALLWSLRHLPMAVALPVAEWTGLAAGRLIGRWNRTADENLRLAMPQLDARGRRSVQRGVHRNLGRVALALAKLPTWPPDKIRQQVRIHGLSHFHAAQAKGKGVLLLTAHLGNWELGALAHGAVVSPISVVVRPIANPLVDSMVESRRQSFGNRVIRKRSAAREILRDLAANRTVGILADQHASPEEAVVVVFFDRPAASHKALAQLALRSGAAVVPAAARWDAAKRRHVITYRPELDLQRTDDPNRDVRVNTQRFQSEIENLVRETPDQWLWIHRRWKASEPARQTLTTTAGDADGVY